MEILMIMAFIIIFTPVMVISHEIVTVLIGFVGIAIFCYYGIDVVQMFFGIPLLRSELGRCLFGFVIIFVSGLVSKLHNEANGGGSYSKC